MKFIIYALAVMIETATNAELLVHYEFNNTNILTTTASDASTNAIHAIMEKQGVGAAALQTATGVSGLPGDYAYDGSSADGMGSVATTNRCRIKYQGSAFNTSNESITVCGWFKTESITISNTVRILEALGTENLGVFEAAGQGLRFSVGVKFVDSGANTYTNAQSWVFFAITYDSTASANNVKFYSGSPSGLSLVATKTLTGAGAWDGLGASGEISIGNGYGLTRPLDGYMDDFRIYGASSGSSGALSYDLLNEIRMTACVSDQGNSSIPGTLAARLSAAAGNAPTNVVLSADGVYNVGTTLKVPAGVTLERNTNCNAIIRATPALDNGILISLTNQSELLNLIVDGNHEVHTLVSGRFTDSVGIFGGEYKNTKNDYTTASASPNMAANIDLQSSSHALVMDAEISNAGAPKNTSITNWSGSRLGMDLCASDNAVVDGVTISNTLGGGIGVAGAQETTVKNCLIEHVGLQNCYGVDGASDGIVGYHSEPSWGRPTTTLLVSGCTIRNYWNHGIHVSGDDISIESNEITGTIGWFPIYVGDYKQPPELSYDISIQGNVIEGLADPQGCVKLEHFSWEGFSFGDLSPNTDYATGKVLNELENVFCIAQEQETDNHKNHTLAEFNWTTGVVSVLNISGLSVNATNISGTLSTTGAYLYAYNLDAKITNYNKSTTVCIRCDEVDYVNLRMHLPTGATGGKVRLLWGTTLYDGIASNRCIELNAIEGWNTYKFRVAGHTNWVGYLDDIRIDPCNSKSNLVFKIDFIRLTKDDPSIVGFNDNMELFAPSAGMSGYAAEQFLLEGTSTTTSAFIYQSNIDTNMTATCQFANTSNNIACTNVDFISVKMNLPTNVGTATVNLLWGTTGGYDGIHSSRQLKIAAQPGLFTYKFPVKAYNVGWAGYVDDLRFTPCNGQINVPFAIESFRMSKKDPSIGEFVHDLAQWQPAGCSNYSISTGEIRGTTTNSAGAYIYSYDIDTRLNAVGVIDNPTLRCHIPCTNVNYVSMKLWLPSDVTGGQVRFLWGTTINQGIYSGRSIALNAEAGWQVYTFEVGGLSGWTGSLDDVRIYPCDGKSNIFFRISYIILSEDEPTLLY
jgi:hypothetical protein